MSVGCDVNHYKRLPADVARQVDEWLAEHVDLVRDVHAVELLDDTGHRLRVVYFERWPDGRIADLAGEAVTTETVITAGRPFPPAALTTTPTEEPRP